MTVLESILADKANRIAFEELCRALRRRGPKPIAMIGAGTSVRLGYPSWSGLLDRLDDAARALQRDQAPPPVRDYPDMLWRAEEYRRRIGDQPFQNAVREIFRPTGKSDPFLDDLVRLPFSHFVTTNYDPALEEAHHRVHRRAARSITWHDAEVLEFITRVADPGYRRRYLHLHGRWDQPERIVLSDGDYTRLYVQSDDTPRKLFAIFALRRFVFIGFSLSDPDLMEVLREVAARMGGGQARHFALVGYRQGENLEMHRNRFMGKFGVAPVFFDTTGDNYEGLPALVGALLARCGRGTAPVPAAPPAFLDEVGPPPPNDVGFAPTEQRAEPTFAFGPIVPIGNATTGPLPPHAQDPHKGRFGGKAAAGGRELRAWVRPAKISDWFEVTLDVVAREEETPLEEEVVFHLHPTFKEDRVVRRARGGVARVTVTAWGAFTVGVEVGETRLELDLAELPHAPMAFRLR